MPRLISPWYLSGSWEEPFQINEFACHLFLSLWVKYQLKSLSVLWSEVLLHKIIVWVDSCCKIYNLWHATQIFYLYELSCIQCITRWINILTIRLLVYRVNREKKTYWFLPSIITINCGKFWKRWEYQTTWPASWETCMQLRKQQLELDMEQQTGSR